MWPLTKPKARHFLALAIFLPSLLATIYTVTINSSDYEKAAAFVSSDERIKNSIGEIERLKFNFFSGFDSSGYNANYTFYARAESGEFNIDVYLKKDSGVWYVETFKIRSLKEAIKP